MNDNGNEKFPIQQRQIPVTNSRRAFSDYLMVKIMFYVLIASGANEVFPFAIQ